MAVSLALQMDVAKILSRGLSKCSLIFGVIGVNAVNTAQVTLVMGRNGASVVVWWTVVCEHSTGYIGDGEEWCKSSSVVNSRL